MAAFIMRVIISAVMFGGGQISEANIVDGLLIESLLKKGIKVYGVHKSFMGLANPNCYEEFSNEKAKAIQMQAGTYLSTCRNVNPASDMWFYKIMKTLKEKGVNVLFITGGDGSSRAANEFIERAKAEGYNDLKIIFIPCTIDGIAGSDSIGINSAVKESKRESKLIMANSFATWNPEFFGPRIAVIEAQGRNRNDIAVRVVRGLISDGMIGSYPIDKIKLKFIPTAYEWSFDILLKDLVSVAKKISTESGKEVYRGIAIIVSEGAKPTEKYWDIIAGGSVGEKIVNLIKQTKEIEANLAKVGYLSQTNDNISNDDIEEIKEWISCALNAMDETNESIAIVRNKEHFKWVPLENFAKATNSKKGIELTNDEVAELIGYLP